MFRQELSDWHGGVALLAGGILDVGQQRKWQLRCQSFLSSLSGESDAARKAAWSTRYVPNLETIYAFQGALVSAGMGIEDLRMVRPTRELAAGEERYFGPSEDLPEDCVDGPARRLART